MTTAYDFGMVGLGVMGSNLLLNLADHGYAVIGYDLNPERGTALETAATAGTRVKGVNSLEVMVQSLRRPRKIMMLVPAGAAVDAVIEKLDPLLEEGDILVDGGNSFYKDTNARVARLKERGFHFMGMGVSGGELGARTGPSMMPGGDFEAWKELQPLLESIAAKAEGTPCVAYMGRHAAGHYVKMVHNGIEYAMMQLIAEAYDIMKRGLGCSNDELYAAFKGWNKGRLQSFLINTTAEVLKVTDGETGSHIVDLILDKAGSKGTGRWTSEEALALPVSVPTIDAAVSARTLSGYKELRLKAEQLYPGTEALRTDKETALADLEAALLFSFLISYVQGLSQLEAASEAYDMAIPLSGVVNVWRSGCIIRSTLLGEFAAAFGRDAHLPNLLLDEGIAALIRATEGAARRTLCAAVEGGIPVLALGTAVSYFDSIRSGRLPTNLIQAQRDFFGAHTYRRIDREGVFHTEWHG